MTLPQVQALNKAWRRTPPPAIQLARIAAALGLKPEQATKAKPADDPAALEALMKVLPVRHGLPANDPTLDWIKDL